jgi:hypothetical protein
VIEKEIDKLYKKGQSVDVCPSYRGIVLFKMMLLQTWYNMSDPEVENMVNDSLSAMSSHSLLSGDRKKGYYHYIAALVLNR